MIHRRAGLAALIATAAATAVAVGLLYPQQAGAHGFVTRSDLPIPEWLFAWGASLVLIVTFVALTVAWQRPLLQERNWRPAPGWLSAALVNPVTEGLAGAVGVFLLAFAVYSGIEGTDAPDRNFTLTFVYVTFWLGMVMLSVLFGNVFRAFNPWRAIGRVAGSAFRLIAGQPAPHASYPERLGRWPAVIGLVGFLWLELVYALASGGVTPGLTPHSVSVAILVYSGLTFALMAAYGTEAWIRKGETFSVYMEMFSRISPLEVREGRLGVRRFLSGLSDWISERGSVALVLVTIGGTTYDGASEGALKDPIADTFQWLLDRGLDPSFALRLTGTLFMALTIAFVSLIFWLGLRGMRTVSDRYTVTDLAQKFGHAFVPIALAYLVTHYFSLLIFQGQAQFSYLLSDPLGDGSDIFGTASTQIDYGLIGAEAIWYVQVGALVVGHMVALALGHDRAISLYGDAKLAARSQYWMLGLMVGFTCLGLFLLSQANE